MPLRRHIWPKSKSSAPRPKLIRGRRKRLRSQTRSNGAATYLTYTSPSWVTAAPSHSQFLVRVRNRCLRIVFHVPRRMTSSTLKVLFDGENLEEFPHNLDKNLFKKTLASENSALEITITQKTRAATKHTTATESLRKL
ncbi:hypothetical protein Trydic_g22544 [Trypoxylus dichotomus]